MFNINCMSVSYNNVIKNTVHILMVKRKTRMFLLGFLT
jgi:hypothetical protein